MNDEIREQALHVLQYYAPMDSDDRNLRWRDYFAEEFLIDEDDEDTLISALIMEALDHFRDHNSERNGRATRVLRDKETLFCGDCREPIKDTDWGMARASNHEDPASPRFWMTCPHCHVRIMSPEDASQIEEAIHR